MTLSNHRRSTPSSAPRFKRYRSIVKQKCTYSLVKCLVSQEVAHAIAFNIRLLLQKLFVCLLCFLGYHLYSKKSASRSG